MKNNIIFEDKAEILTTDAYYNRCCKCVNTDTEVTDEPCYSCIFNLRDSFKERSK
jgi:hypothetical protein